MDKKEKYLLASLYLILFAFGFAAGVATTQEVYIKDFIEYQQNKYYENEVVCLEDSCSVELLKTEQAVACYKGCKYYNGYGEVSQCFDYCENFYQGD